MKKLLSKISNVVTENINSNYNLDIAVRLETPPTREHGDIACTVAFDIAGKLKRPPKIIAGEVIESFPAIEEVDRIEVAGAGYINFYLKRDIFLSNLINSGFKPESDDSRNMALTIEHTSINPNKTPHVGHIRNSVLGDTLARLAVNLGYSTIVQNYIDNTGVQVADVVLGLMKMKNMSIDQIKTIGDRLDRYCWDLYSEVSTWLNEDPSRQLFRAEFLHQLEKNEGAAAGIGEYVSSTILIAHLKLMERIGIRYNLVAWERDVLYYKLWDEAFEILKKNSLIFYAEEGEKSGCWVMDLKGDEEFAEMDDPDKILVRSNNTITYTGKDIAYHFWKSGLLSTDFNYEKFYHYKDGKVVWTSTMSKGEGPDLEFNKGDIVVNVIDVRQSYPQKVVQAAVRGVKKEAVLKHYAYEMVTLTPEAAGELGFKLEDEDRDRKFVSMSGRKGLGVKADDLIDLLKVKAIERIKANNPEFDGEIVDRIAEQVTIGALRYFLLKFNKNKIIVFDFNEALNFEGDTGPYIQYAIVRCNSIFRKLAAAGIFSGVDQTNTGTIFAFDNIKENEEAEFTWDFIFNLSRYNEILEQAFNSLDLSLIASWAYEVSQKFNSYYHKYSILNEKDTELQKARIFIIHIFKTIMEGIAGIMGLPIPEIM